RVHQDRHRHEPGADHVSARLRGFAFPFRIDAATGRVATADGDDKLRQNLVHLILTAAGERVMRREYGAGLRSLVHDPNDDALRVIAAHQIQQAIEAYEPRVELRRLDVTQDGATLLVRLEYAVRRTGRLGAVTVPIGTQEG